jgi:hypothetical protein
MLPLGECFGTKDSLALRFRALRDVPRSSGFGWFDVG